MQVPAHAFAIPTTTVSARLIGGASILLGWSFVETTGAAIASLTLFDGDGSNGAIVAPITLQAGQSTRDWLGAPGLLMQRGLFLAVNAGSIQGSVFVVPARDYTLIESEQGAVELAGFYR